MSDARRAVSDEATCSQCGADRRGGTWCPLCYERYERYEREEEAAEPAPAVGRVRAPRAYSRTKGGPTSFGLVGRVSLSIVPALVAFFAVRNVMRSRHDPTVAYYLVLGVPALMLVAGFLAAVWRRERVS